MVADHQSPISKNMRHLTVVGLILALISIAPASVLVCGSVLTPELILQLNEEHNYDLEIDCLPQSSTLNFSTLDFSSFMQHGFYAAFFLMVFAISGNYRFVQDRLPTIIGWIPPTLTPPPTFVVS